MNKINKTGHLFSIGNYMAWVQFETNMHKWVFQKRPNCTSLIMIYIEIMRQHDKHMVIINPQTFGRL